MDWISVGVVLVGVALPMGLAVWFSIRRRRREEIEEAISGFYRETLPYKGADLVLWADPRHPASVDRSRVTQLSSADSEVWLASWRKRMHR